MNIHPQLFDLILFLMIKMFIFECMEMGKADPVSGLIDPVSRRGSVDSWLAHIPSLPTKYHENWSTTFLSIILFINWQTNKQINQQCICRSLKPGFHYPSWRPELTARVDGWPVSITRQHGQCWRARVSTSGVDGPSTRVVETGL